MESLMKIITHEKYEIFIFGKPKNWKDDFRNHPEIHKILQERDIGTVYIPEVSSFPGKISKPDEFSLADKFLGIDVRNGKVTEGTIIPKRAALLIYSADCPTIVYFNQKDQILIAAHAGLQSVTDKGRILNNRPLKEHESVVNDIMLFGKETKDCVIKIVCGISHNSFCYDPKDPGHGKNNMKLLRYLRNHFGDLSVPYGLCKGNISIQEIIKKQFISYGVQESNIETDGIDTGNDDRFWSHSKSFREGKKDCGRNAVLVLHK